MLLYFLQSHGEQMNLNQFWGNIMIQFMEKVKLFIGKPKLVKSDFLKILA